MANGDITANGTGLYALRCELTITELSTMRDVACVL
jgi:hypothetical protein